MNHSLIAAWKDLQDGIGEEPQLVALIKATLLTKTQAKWLAENNLSIEDLLNGRYPIDKETIVVYLCYRNWNKKLIKEGLRPAFSEDIVGNPMLNEIEKLMGPFKFY